MPRLEGEVLLGAASAQDALGDRAEAIGRAEEALRLLADTPEAEEARELLAGWGRDPSSSVP